MREKVTVVTCVCVCHAADFDSVVSLQKGIHNDIKLGNDLILNVTF